jgi:hypothetical protein
MGINQAQETNTWKLSLLRTHMVMINTKEVVARDTADRALRPSCGVLVLLDRQQEDLGLCAALLRSRPYSYPAPRTTTLHLLLPSISSYTCIFFHIESYLSCPSADFLHYPDSAAPSESQEARRQFNRIPAGSDDNDLN